MSSVRKSKLVVLSLAVVLSAGITCAQAQTSKLPSALKVIKVVPSDRQLTATVTTSRSVSPILNFEYSLNGGTSWIAESPAVTSGPINITGLTNGQSYQVAVRAVNAEGTGPTSNIKVAKPATIPDVPHVDYIKGTGMWFNVYFTAGASDGGSPVTQWQFDIDQTGRWQHWGKGSSSPQVVMMPWAKLGDSHVIRIRAVNAVGTSYTSNLVSVTMFKTGLHTFQ